MTNNPLRRAKYDYREFHRYNFELRRSIRDYDIQMELQRLKDNRYPKARYNAKGRRICADSSCEVELKHARSLLCEAHREDRYQEAKYKAYRSKEARDALRGKKLLRGVRVPGVPQLVPDRD